MITDQMPQPKLQPPRGLLTATPSRPFFPRGFYWCAQILHYGDKLLTLCRDEGFHLLLIGEWDNGLRLVLNLDLFKSITHRTVKLGDPQRLVQSYRPRRMGWS